MRRALFGLVIGLTAVGCQPSALTAKEKPVTVQSIAPQPGDVSGLQRCTESGDVDAGVVTTIWLVVFDETTAKELPKRTVAPD